MKLTKRLTKGSKLSIEEMDENLDYLNAQASVWENDIDDRIRPKNGKLVRRRFHNITFANTRIFKSSLYNIQR